MKHVVMTTTKEYSEVADISKDASLFLRLD